MAVHRLQPSPSGLQCSTARSPVLLHGPRLTGARTGRRAPTTGYVHPLSFGPSSLSSVLSHRAPKRFGLMPHLW
ncbi:hypothetical protein ZEAMMB73_Zm00001d053036 [Zea mays]|uniref:Uncharacterized protein n=1 Tax=Zea mays TaxID=4577 RepID=K7UNX9_MAIZE|nr:hypothetical protein ZEAMMB73_Zm00001d053036 [Zea mays]